jgi:hypothetical protein
MDLLGAGHMLLLIVNGMSISKYIYVHQAKLIKTTY